MKPDTFYKPAESIKTEPPIVETPPAVVFCSKSLYHFYILKVGISWTSGLCA
jgi:hypothetical protein